MNPGPNFPPRIQTCGRKSGGVLHTNVSICELRAVGNLRFSLKHILTLTCKICICWKLVIYFRSFFPSPPWGLSVLPFGGEGADMRIIRASLGQISIKEACWPGAFLGFHLFHHLPLYSAAAAISSHLGTSLALIHSLFTFVRLSHHHRIKLPVTPVSYSLAFLSRESKTHSSMVPRFLYDHRGWKRSQAPLAEHL